MRNANNFNHEMTKTLSNVLNKSGSDKQSDHNYAHAYAYLFEKTGIDFDSAINFLEIGISNTIAEVSSLHAWAELFPNASIFGMDIDPAKMIESDRIKTGIANQSDIVDLSRFMSSIKYAKFDVILDDGSHVFVDAVRSFDYFIRYLKPNGLYMIEDVSKLEQSWEQTIYDWDYFLQDYSLSHNLSYEIIDTRPDNSRDDSVIVAVWKN